MKKKIQFFSERYNAENLRIILHGIHIDMNHEDIIARLIPVANYSLDYYKKLLSLTIPQIISEQKEPILQKQLRRAFEEFKKTERFTPLESAIDQYVYSVLPKVSPHYEMYVNMKNILALCRCLTLNIPAYRYILPNPFIAKALNSTSISEVLEKYNYYPYSAVFSEYIGRKEIPLHTLEFAVERYLLKIWRKAFRYSTVLNSDSIVGFFEMKLAETMDVIRIIVGVSAGFSEQEIRESLLYYSII
jgi:vacuolar-type H+-ATPase subunit C/Vma6